MSASLFALSLFSPKQSADWKKTVWTRAVVLSKISTRSTVQDRYPSLVFKNPSPGVHIS